MHFFTLVFINYFQFSELSKDLAEAKDKILHLNEAQSHRGNDLIGKEERILALKTNLSCTEERLKLKEEEVGTGFFCLFFGFLVF